MMPAGRNSKVDGNRTVLLFNRQAYFLLFSSSGKFF